MEIELFSLFQKSAVSCSAVVVTVYPLQALRYAVGMVEAAVSLSESQLSARLVGQDEPPIVTVMNCRGQAWNAAILPS